MAGAQGAALAAAVCNAGALGSLPAAMHTPASLERELAGLRALTPQAFNVNFFCHTPPLADPVVETRWMEILRPHYQQWQLNERDMVPGPGRAPFSEAMAEVLESFKPAVVSFHFGLPAVALLARVKAMGSLVMSSATTVEEGLWLQDHGADIVIAQGLEAGGHRGLFLHTDLNTQRPLVELLPSLVQALSIPVIAAGGIAEEIDVATAMAMGAAGVQVGTAYLTCHEAMTTPLHRRALQATPPRASAITNIFTGRPARGIVNYAMQRLGPLNPETPAFPLATAAMAPLRARAELADSDDFSPLWAGTNLKGCLTESAAATTDRLAKGFGSMAL